MWFVNYVWSTRSFFFGFSLTAIKNSKVFTDIATSVMWDVTGRCLLTRFNKTEWKYGMPLILINSRNASVSRTHRISACTKRSLGTVEDVNKYIGPIQCKNTACVYWSVFDLSQDMQTMALLCFPVAFNAHFWISNRNLWILAAQSSWWLT